METKRGARGPLFCFTKKPPLWQSFDVDEEPVASRLLNAQQEPDINRSAIRQRRRQRNRAG